MKTKLFPIIIALALAGCASAIARIGETESQVEKRYGKMQDSFKSAAGERRRYSFRGFFVFVDFERGVSQMETYQKKNISEPMLAEEMAGLCGANSNGGTWTTPEENGGQFFSYTRNHRPKLVAIYTVASRDMIITTKEFLDRASLNINAAARKKMQDF